MATAKATKHAKAVSEPVAAVGPTETVTVTVSVPTETEEQRWERVQKMRKEGTLRAALLHAVRAHARSRVEHEDDQRWASVLKASDEEIWTVIEWCDFERGAISMMARSLNKRAAATKPEGAAV